MNVHKDGTALALFYSCMSGMVSSVSRVIIQDVVIWRKCVQCISLLCCAFVTVIFFSALR